MEFFRDRNIRVTTEVTFRDPQNPRIEARIDQVLSGEAGSAIPVPQGYSAIDLATGKPVSHIALDTNGKAGVEIKTGNAQLERHQATVYQGCIAGEECMIAFGKKAHDAELKGIPPSNIYILRPRGYTWHHHQDAGYMQLVPMDLHNAIRHTGGISRSK